MSRPMISGYNCIFKRSDSDNCIERENSSLKGVLPKVYARQNLDPTSLGELIDMIGNIALGDAKSRSADILGHVFEYFLGEFALAEGKKGGQFYTPRSVVELLVQMLEPYKGRVFDPCCGSGGMFVQSEKFVDEHKGKINDISIYGQESNQTTWRLAKMNLAIRGLDSSQVKWNNEGSFTNDAHQDLKADFILANPPFNMSDWGGEKLKSDGRWKYGTPPIGNANFAWIQHMIYHLSLKGIAGVVLGNSSLSAINTGEGFIRKSLIENDIIECIVTLPKQLFLNTSIPACIWFLNRNKRRKRELLMIDARNFGVQISTSQKILTQNDIKKVTEIFKNWKSTNEYNDIEGFCKSVTIDDITNNEFNLSLQWTYLHSGSRFKRILQTGTGDQDKITLAGLAVSGDNISVDSRLRMNNRLQFLDLLVQTAKWMLSYKLRLQPFGGLRYFYFKSDKLGKIQNVDVGNFVEITFGEKIHATGALIGLDMKYLLSQWVHFFSNIHTGILAGQQRVNSSIQAGQPGQTGIVITNDGKFHFALSPFIAFQFGIASEFILWEGSLASIRLFYEMFSIMTNNFTPKTTLFLASLSLVKSRLIKTQYGGIGFTIVF